MKPDDVLNVFPKPGELGYEEMVLRLSKLGTNDSEYLEELYNGLVDLALRCMLHYEKGEPITSDADYDSLIRKIATVERSAKTLREDSPTQRIGMVVSNRPPVEHIHPMQSLDNVFNETEFRKWMDDTFDACGESLMVGELKFDGLAIELEYTEGVLTGASTRGDGKTGECVMSNIKHVPTIPLEIYGQPVTLFVRGELVLLRADFERLNEEAASKGTKPYVNPRNAIAGIVRNYDSAYIRNAKPVFFAYEVIGGPTIAYQDRSTKMGDLEFLAKLGFKTGSHQRLCNGVESCLEFYNEVLSNRGNLPHDIDGVVFKVDNLFKHHLLGSTSKFPKHSIAFKLPPEEVTTTITDVVFQVGRTGVVTPVANVVPVFVGGVTVTNVTLHNIDEIVRLDVHYGDTVFVRRAGDVIPQITRAVESLRPDNAIPIRFPVNCPCCNSELNLDDSRGDVAVRCRNPECVEQLIQRIVYLGSRVALDIDGLGESTAKLLIAENNVKDIADIFYLTEINGLSPLMSSKLIANINAAKINCRLSSFITALGIPDIGPSVAKELAKFFNNDYELFSKTMLSTLSADFKPPKIPDMGPERWLSIKDFMFSFWSSMDLLYRSGFVFTQPIRTIDSRYTGRTVVITGSFDTYTRDDIKQQLEILGAKVSDSVSAKTHFLICGEGAGTKLTKAQSLGIPIITTLDDIMGP